MDPANLLAASVAVMRIAAGELTSEGLVRACLERIAERDADVGAWEHVDPEATLAEARARDTSPPLGPLHGMPVGVKDIIDTADMPTGYGSPIWRGHRPARAAACVALVRAAGGVVLGKTVTTEFAYFTPGEDRQPPRPGTHSRRLVERLGGGRGRPMVPVALGTQTAGSIIRPAAFCGVVGYKPSFGTISRSGVLSFAESLDTVGALSRSVADAALLASVAARRADLLVPDTPGPVPRVGVHRTADWELVSAGSQAAVTDTARRLARAGAAVSDAVLPTWFAELPSAQGTVMAFEAARSFAPEFASTARASVRRCAPCSTRAPASHRRSTLTRSASPRLAARNWRRCSSGTTWCSRQARRVQRRQGWGQPATRSSTAPGRCSVRPVCTCRPAPASTDSPLAPSSSAGLATTPASWRWRRGQSGSWHERRGLSLGAGG